VAYLVTPFFLAGEEALMANILAFSVAAVSGVLGVGWIIRGAGQLKDRGEQPFRFGSAGGWLGLGLAGLGGGLAVQALPLRPYLFPIFHTWTIVAWGGLLLSLPYRRWGPLPFRDVLSQVSYGGFAATTLSGLVEIVLLILGTVTIFLIMSVLPGGQAWQAEVEALLQELMASEDPSQAMALLRMPVIAIAFLFTLAVVVPLVEESLKTLGVLWLGRRGESRRQFIMWGLVSGLAFGLLESLVNVSMAGALWGVVVVARLFTMAMHALTGGLMGAGWYYGQKERRWGRLFVFFLLAVLIHGLWNGIVALGILVPAFAESLGV
jgi:RsiW-degrading membrane proteinase PrsW (M82 family)